MKVWVGSAWFSNSEPFMSLAIDGKLPKSEAMKIFDRVLEEDISDMYERADWGDDTLEEEFFDDVRVSGLFLKELESMASGSALVDAKRDIKSQGYAYLSTAY